ncbi:MAG: hypothetical protein KA712_22595 [Myxococcales bacterium]|nr:hypothetical protein [Myxococcales bacterium]
MADYKIPKALKTRIADVAQKHDLGTPETAADHFITRGLKAYEAPAGSVKQQLAYLVDEQGYSSIDEAVEHLLVRGLRAYEESASSPEELEARLRGLGYID